MKFNPRTILFIIAAVAVVLLFAVGPGYQKKAEQNKLEKGVQISDTDHLYGSPDAVVTIVEFSDIECPYCRSAHPILKSVVDNSNGTVNWVYKHFPLSSIHPKAIPFAQLTECVSKVSGNDAFWTALDSLMADGDEQKALARAGLSKEAVASCLGSQEVSDILVDHMQQAETLGVEGTPFILVKGPRSIEKIPGTPNKAQLEQIVLDLQKPEAQ